MDLRPVEARRRLRDQIRAHRTRLASFDTAWARTALLYGDGLSASAVAHRRGISKQAVMDGLYRAMRELFGVGEEAGPGYDSTDHTGRADGDEDNASARRGS